MYNRQALKQRAKRLIGWGNPAMFLITLVYVLGHNVGQLAVLSGSAQSAELGQRDLYELV